MEDGGGARKACIGWRRKGGLETPRYAARRSECPPLFMRVRIQAAKKAVSSSTAGPSTPVTPTAIVSGVKPTDNRSAKSDGVKIDFTGDKTRDKCAELIYDALVFDSGARTFDTVVFWRG